MKVKRTFFNSRKDRLYDDYVDINNYLWIILFDSGAELTFILRDLKKDNNVINYIYKKLHSRFDNIMEIEKSTITDVELSTSSCLYQHNRHIIYPSIIKIC